MEEMMKKIQMRATICIHSKTSKVLGRRRKRGMVSARQDISWSMSRPLEKTIVSFSLLCFVLGGEYDQEEDGDSQNSQENEVCLPERDPKAMESAQVSFGKTLNFPAFDIR